MQASHRPRKILAQSRELGEAVLQTNSSRCQNDAISNCTGKSLIGLAACKPHRVADLYLSKQATHRNHNNPQIPANNPKLKRHQGMRSASTCYLNHFDQKHSIFPQTPERTHLSNMRYFACTLIVTSSILAGCASKQPATQAPASTQAATRSPAPIRIPAASTQRIVMSMTGPKQVIDSKDWGDFKREWKDTFSEYAKEAKITFDFIEGEVRPNNQDGTMLIVDVADYRMVGIGSRIMFGIMTGNSFIDAQVKYSNLKTGETLGEQQFNTTSSAWSGIFAKVTPQQVDSIGLEVFKNFKAAE